MNTEQDIRWVQRFSNFQKALKRLRQAIKIVTNQKDFDDDVDVLLKEGVIQCFEYTHELAWKVMKDYAEYQGYTDIHGSRDAIRQALAMNIIDDRRWMESIVDRNLTSHLYDDDKTDLIYNVILNVYYPLFNEFESKMEVIANSLIA